MKKTKWQQRALLSSSFVFLLIGMWGFSRVLFEPHTKNFFYSPPRAVAGDEAEYLLVINSLLFDHDLELQEDYRRVKDGSPQAGARFRRFWLQHHSFLVNPHTREHYLFSNVLPPGFHCVAEECIAYLRDQKFPITSDFVEKSAHPIGFSLIVASLVGLTFPTLDQVEGRVHLVILLFSWMTAVLTYVSARRFGLSPLSAFLSVALLVLASPWLAYARSFFSEPLSGLVLLIGLLSMQSGRPKSAALTAVVAVVIKPAFGVIGLGWVLERLLSRRFRQALHMTLILGIGALLFCAFNYWQTGALVVAGHMDWTKVWGAPNPLRTLFDGQYGLIPFVPWSIVALVALGASFRRDAGDPTTLSLRQMSIPIAFYLILLSFHQPLGGGCYGCRYWVPFLPWLALAALLFAVRRGNFVKGLTCYLALLGFVIAVPGALTYPFAWNREPHESLMWFLRKSPY